MCRPPRAPSRPLLGFALGMRTALVTLVMLAGAFWLFGWEQSRAEHSVAAARTAVVNLIIFVELAYLFNCRSLHRPCLSPGFFGNRWVFVGAIAMTAAQILFTYSPVMNRMFHSAPIDLGSWLRIVAVVAAVFVIVEFEKWLRFGRGRRDHALPE